MDKPIRKTQKEVLEIFSRQKTHFALCGGTALELFYLQHRFSKDLDFFAPHYRNEAVERLVACFSKELGVKIKFNSQFLARGRARVKFYDMPIKKTKKALKIDFVEDVLFDKPAIKSFGGVRVYDAKCIYLQKLAAIGGNLIMLDEAGREFSKGRAAARDVYDLYLLSKKIQPLHLFLKKQSSQIQRGLVHWYQTFSRQQLKFDLLDLDIYDKKFDSREMIAYLEKEIKEFIASFIE